MSRHRFDPVALVFGLVFVAAGAIVLAGGRLIDEGRVLPPLALVGLGIALLLRTASPNADAPASARPTPAADTSDSAWPGTTWPDEPTDVPLADAPTTASAATTSADGPARTPHDARSGPVTTPRADDEPETPADDPQPTGGTTPPADEQPDADEPGADGDGPPSRDFYLGPDWRPPAERPGDPPPG